jgi:hypothetical protein
MNESVKKQITNLLLSHIKTKNEVGMANLLSTVNKDGFVFDAEFFESFLPHASTKIVDKLLKWGFDKDEMLMGCLKHTEIAVSSPFIKIILDSGANPNYVDSDGMTAFWNYCKSDQATLKTVQLFIDHGANPKIPATGYMPALEKLLELGALIDGQHPQSGNTCLHHCCMEPDPIHVEILLEHGANPNIKNNSSATPLDVLHRQVSKGIHKNTSDLAACVVCFYKRGLITLDWISSLPTKDISLPMAYIEALHTQLDKEALFLLEGRGDDVLRAKVDVSPSPEKHTNPFTCPYHLLQECFEQTMKEMMAIPQCSKADTEMNKERIKHMTTKFKLMAVIAQNSVLGKSVLESHAQAYESNRKSNKVNK